MKRALESYFHKCINERFEPNMAATHDLSMRAHRHLAKVTSFYLRSLAKPVEHWLLFECCSAFLVLLIGFMTSEGTFESCIYLLPLHVDDELSSWTTLFQAGGDDTGRPSVFTASCASTPTRHAKVNLLLYACLQLPILNGMLLHPPSYVYDRYASTSTEEREPAIKTRGLKAEVTEAWKRRRKKGTGCSGAQTGVAGPAAEPSGAKTGEPVRAPTHPAPSPACRLYTGRVCRRTNRRPARPAGSTAGPSGATSGTTGLLAGTSRLCYSAYGLYPHLPLGL